MATIKIKFRPSSVSMKEGCICYRVIHRRVTRQITSGYKLFPWEWDIGRSEIIMSPGDTDRKTYLLKLKKRMDGDLKRLGRIIGNLESEKDSYTSDIVVKLYNKQAGGDSFISYARRLVERLHKAGKVRTSETYTSALNSFVRFHGDDDMPLDKIDSDLMISYESYLKTEGVCTNSSSYYMRNLRAIYNRAVDEGLTEQQFPFKHVYTGIAKTIKRAIPLKEIRRIKDMDLLGEPALEYARDMFMMSFYTRGMSVIDMAYLKKTDLSSGILSYRRKKTGQLLTIKWEKPMQEVLDKYNVESSPFLLPIIEGDALGDKARRQYRNGAHFINCKLKLVGKRLGLPMPLTLYVARHCWASIARSKNVPVSVISEGMGHDSEKTTLLYLASLDTTAIDKANSLILRSL